MTTQTASELAIETEVAIESSGQDVEAECIAGIPDPITFNSLQEVEGSAHEMIDKWLRQGIQEEPNVIFATTTQRLGLPSPATTNAVALSSSIPNMTNNGPCGGGEMLKRYLMQNVKQEGVIVYAKLNSGV